MSKAHDPHWRYVAFRLHGTRALSRRAVQNAVKGRARKDGVPDDFAPQLTRYEWPHAIVRVDHRHLADLRASLPRITWAVEDTMRVDVRVETLSSSGTIRALTDRLGVLRQRAGDGAARSDRAGRPRGPAPATDPVPPPRKAARKP